MSSLWLDHKFASLVGVQLSQFKVIKARPYSARFRCPICGDSQKSKYKTRGYFYEHSGKVNVKCHNCDYSSSLSKFIQTINPPLYSEYRLEYLRNDPGSMSTNNQNMQFTTDITKFATRRVDHFDPFTNIKKISQLHFDHPAKKYVVERKIPSNTHYRMFYVPTYYNWVNELIPDKFSPKVLLLDEPRIVLPFIDHKGYVFGFTGRSIKKDSTLRYSTIILDDTKDKVFGIDSIDRKKRVYVVEGPIDSLFLENCVAMAGSDINFDSIGDQDKLVIVYDNEPRNKEIVNKLEKVIDRGYYVCIWPDYIQQKDVNDMVKSGTPPAIIQGIIDQNTYRGLSAKMKVQQWKKT